MESPRRPPSHAPLVLLLGAVLCLVGAGVGLARGAGAAVHASAAVPWSGVAWSLAFLLACLAYNHGRSWVRGAAAVTWGLALLTGLHWAVQLAGSLTPDQGAGASPAASATSVSETGSR